MDKYYVRGTERRIMKAFSLRMDRSPFSRFRFRAFPRKAITWWIAFACAVLGLLTGLHIVIVPLLAGYSYWIVLAGLIVLLVATR